MYPRPTLGSVNCADPTNVADASCGDLTPQNSGLDWNTLIELGLADATQLIAPGTPSPVPLYTPGTTVAAKALTSPLVLVGLAAAAVLLLRRR